jgi:hypothetical protein
VRVIARALLLLGGALVACCATAGETPPVSAGLQRNVAFSGYSPAASSTELVRRLLSPLSALAVREESTSSGRPLNEQRIDLANERFTVYVPRTAAPLRNGFARPQLPGQPRAGAYTKER